jgi:hypothetical protein
MELLKNPIINQKISNRIFFDLSKNNQRLSVIYSLEDEPIKKLMDVFDKIVTDDVINDGYYQLRNFFSLAQMIDPNIIIELIIGTVEKKISTINECIFDDNDELNDINLAMYFQIWKSYKIFSNKMYNLIKNYQRHLVDRNIQTGKISYDIMSIIQICIFYNTIIEKPDNKNILTIVSDDLRGVNKKNIDQLIDYIDSIRAFITMKNFTNIDGQKLSNIICNIMNKTPIVNIMCIHMHQLLKNLSKQNVINESEYETVNAIDGEKQIIRKIYKIATILSTYSEKNKLLICHSKFMQSRILDLNYDNLELEIEIVRRISPKIGKEESQKLIDAIADIINTKNVNEVIQAAEIKISSDEYIKLTNVSTKILNPIILTKKAWKIYNISDMEPLYPIEMKFYLDVISKGFTNLHNGEYTINWQPTMGSAQFMARLGQKKVDITCNLLQAMALIYLNDNNKTSSNDFSEKLLVNTELSAKIFESLFEANLIIYLSVDEEKNPIYSVNTKNYTGDTKIDIRPVFLDVFNFEIDVGSNKEKNKHSDKEISHNKFISCQVKKIMESIPDIKYTDAMKIANDEWNTQNKIINKSGKKATKNNSKKIVSESDDSDCESDSNDEDYYKSDYKSKSKKIAAYSEDESFESDSDDVSPDSSSSSESEDDDSSVPVDDSFSESDHALSSEPDDISEVESDYEEINKCIKSKKKHASSEVYTDDEEINKCIKSKKIHVDSDDDEINRCIKSVLGSDYEECSDDD